MNALSCGVCTIATKSYISSVRTLFDSLREHHPRMRCWALLIDDWRGYLEAERESCEIVSLADLRLPGTDRLTFQYDVTELATALKPFLLEYLLERAAVDRLLYLDPDILVTNKLDKLFSDVEQADYCVIPHLDTDYPEDALLPDDAHILRAGIFNLGFLGIRCSPRSSSFLRWWQHKLRTKCVVDPVRGYFVDQRFVDLALACFPNVHIEREVGYNVAYWNLHSRRISGGPGHWQCNGGPLYFFHFSGYALDQPDRLSRYLTRYRRGDRPDVQPLFEFYGRCLRERGAEETRGWPYTFGTFRDGAVIPYDLRVRYRAALAQGREIPDPFQGARETERALTTLERGGGNRLKDLARAWIPPALWNGLRRLKGSA
jgi:hypothetical protein